MTDEQKSRFAALQGAWLAVREKRRRAEMAAELDAAIMEFLKLHRAETDTVVLTSVSALGTRRRVTAQRAAGSRLPRTASQYSPQSAVPHLSSAAELCELAGATEGATALALTAHEKIVPDLMI